MTATPSDLARLRRGILEDPADDALRLILADALDEAGDDDRAEFIRVQVLKATRPCGAFMYSCYENYSCYKNGRVCRCDAAANRREAELLLAHDCWDRLPLPSYAGYDEVVPKHDPSRMFHRGFVDSVSLPLADFMQHAKALFDTHPLTTVILTDRELTEQASTGRAGWWAGETADGLKWPDNCDIPLAVFRFIPDAAKSMAQTWGWAWFTPGEEGAALSRALVAYGRDLAKLPPLRAA